MKRHSSLRIGLCLIFAATLAVFARGGGGCFLPETPVLRADGTEVQIRDVRPGDELFAFTSDERIVHAHVQNILTRIVEEHVVVTTSSCALRATLEHPFYVGNGNFKTLEALKPGDSIFIFDHEKLRSQPIVSLERVRVPTLVYNLQTGFPHTFFAGGIAVHNKGGGGGCFPAGTRICTPRGELAIETLMPNDSVLGVDENGRIIPTSIEAVQVTHSPLLILETDCGTLRTTSEHPIQLSTGSFLAAGEISAGSSILAMHNGRSQLAKILRKTLSTDEVPVFNLSVGSPHTFIADGFVVHNKGGGGGGGGHYSGGGGHSSGGGSGGGSPIVAVFIFGVVIFILISSAINKDREEQDLDFTYSRSAIDRKADKTRKLLEFIVKTDPEFASEKLTETARSVFLLLQKCWQARSYDEMKTHMMPDLFNEHLSQIAGMIRNHEIDRIDQIQIKAVDIVNVRYTHKENEREFTALITASARDYYVDDRNNKFLRGDEAPATFQEFWTFQRLNGSWLLREIEQSRESDALKDENFFEPFTDTGRDQVYAETAGKEGPIGPWLESDTETKATKTERLLNFLFQTDKLWDRQAMLTRARQVFTHVKMAWEAGNAATVPPDELFPDALENLKKGITEQRSKGIGIEYRNFCVRKVELILIHNFADNTKDDFTVRISAHAQRIVKQNGRILSQDADVVPFEEYWTFGRLDNQWKLKEVLPPATGEKMIGQENLDQESNPEQLEWYYRQTRAT